MLRQRFAQRPAGFIEPCLPSKVYVAPDGPGWLHEIKHDGFRMIVRREGATVRLFTRGGHDWADRYPSVVEAASGLKAKSFTIDGEVVCCDDKGVAVFDLLREGKRENPAAFVFAFDLVELDGDDLRRLPIEQRKDRLARLISRAGFGLALCEHLAGDGPSIFAAACRMGLEGIVSKLVGSSYRSGRTDIWRKIKNPEAPAVRRVLEEDWSR